MAFLYEKSATWRWIVRSCRESKSFYLTFATLCGVVPAFVGYSIMQASRGNTAVLDANLRKNASETSLTSANVNNSWLQEYLGELQRKEDTNDRYVAALRGEILVRKPIPRIQPSPNDKSESVNSKE
eukprot:TRINITY_DN4765_c0_g1_i1.p1 TRINITY_DN4765_c0_g1~~TRINITY_DN4765_c0_g1_i1.p1  ORF type:complete len:127 (+),score=4.72 TRINITY_DN4765_c0_g1_i1:147-527(+)